MYSQQEKFTLSDPKFLSYFVPQKLKEEFHYQFIKRRIAQEVEQWSPKPKVGGSSPSLPVSSRDIAQPGSASVLGTEGHVFESHHPDCIRNGIVQLVRTSES